MPSVYLAGPISGLSFYAAQNWRDIVATMLAPEIEALSPLRGKEHLNDGRAIEDSYQSNALSTDRAITTRDHFDVRRCDLVLCNLLGAQRVSIGTVMEIAWAFAYRKPLVLMIEASGNVHDYLMIREATGFRCDTLTRGIYLARDILLPGRPSHPVPADVAAEPFARDPTGRAAMEAQRRAVVGSPTYPSVGAVLRTIEGAQAGRFANPDLGRFHEVDPATMQPFARGHTAAVAARDLGAGDRVRVAPQNLAPDGAGVREAV